MRTDRFIRFRGGATAALVVVTMALASLPATAQTAAVGDGDWSSAATWTNGLPATNNAAYIGSTTPTGAATIATVTLSQNSTAGNVYLGNGAGTAGTLDLNGFTLTGRSLNVGYGGNGSLVRTGGGTLSIGSVWQYGGNLSFATGDVVSQLFISNSATATTATVGNVANRVQVSLGSILTLGGNLTLSDYQLSYVGAFSLIMVDGTLNANGHDVFATFARFGGSGPATFENDGLVTVGGWSQRGGTQIRLNSPGDALGNLTLSENSLLSIGNAPGQISGVTVGGVFIHAGSTLRLDVNGLADGWVFRWGNPSGGDHLADLQSLIGQGRIDIAPINGGSYSLSSDAAYTYVNVVPVPEPSTLVLSLAAAGFMVRRRLKK